MDTTLLINKLFENKSTADLILRVNGQTFPVHRTILQYTSGFFHRYFKADEGAHKYQDYSPCKLALKNWYDYSLPIDSSTDTIPKTKTDYNSSSKNDSSLQTFAEISPIKPDKRPELYYSHHQFHQFLRFLYGYQIELNLSVEDLFTLSYLAKKFEVTPMTHTYDNLLSMNNRWREAENGEERWQTLLDVCKWLDLYLTRNGILVWVVEMIRQGGRRIRNEFLSKLDDDDLEFVLQELANRARSWNNVIVGDSREITQPTNEISNEKCHYNPINGLNNWGTNRIFNQLPSELNATPSTFTTDLMNVNMLMNGAADRIYDAPVNLQLFTSDGAIKQSFLDRSGNGPVTTGMNGFLYDMPVDTIANDNGALPAVDGLISEMTKEEIDSWLETQLENDSAIQNFDFLDIDVDNNNQNYNMQAAKINQLVDGVERSNRKSENNSNPPKDL
ncbi:hypothetical protein G9A89_015967 [Geosiphon pyriformis]|nr:hypothetical protein G9A89_015967 [Geosiphon pyriformis]